MFYLCWHNFLCLVLLIQMVEGCDTAARWYLHCSSRTHTVLKAPISNWSTPLESKGWRGVINPSAAIPIGSSQKQKCNLLVTRASLEWRLLSETHISAQAAAGRPGIYTTTILYYPYTSLYHYTTLIRYFTYWRIPNELLILRRPSSGLKWGILRHLTTI